MDKSIREEDIEFEEIDWSKILGSDIRIKQRMPKELFINNDVERQQKSLAKDQIGTKKMVQRRFNQSNQKIKRNFRNR